MTIPATTSDIEARFRPLLSDDRVVAGTLLTDAWALLLGRRPDLEDQLDSNQVSRGNVVRVLCAMVIRVLRNPEGYLEESIDDYRYRRDAVISTGLLHVTSDELADITPGRQRSRSVRLVKYLDDDYV